jgi:hypothetical protein
MDGNVASQGQMEAHLDVVIEMASYDPFETLVQQGVLVEGASTLKPPQYFGESNQRVEIAKHVLDVLQREMTSMHVQLIEIIMEHNVLHEKLVGTQRRVKMLEQEIALKHEALLKIETKVKETEKNA